MKLRIIKRETVSGTNYVIQEKHVLFRWMWVDSWIYTRTGSACSSSFSTYAKAVEHLKYFKCSSRTLETTMYEI